MSFVGTEMGCGNIKKAKVYVMIGSLLFAIMTVTCSLFLSFFRENLASFFSNENDNKYGKETY
jgi:MATE family multidrug resistance protein